MTVILLGFNDACAGRMASFAHARRVAALTRCGELPGVRASAAAAVRRRDKASGRRVVRRVPRGRIAPAFFCMRQLSLYTRARSRAASARGALGAR